MSEGNAPLDAPKNAFSAGVIRKLAPSQSSGLRSTSGFAKFTAVLVLVFIAVGGLSLFLRGLDYITTASLVLNVVGHCIVMVGILVELYRPDRGVAVVAVGLTVVFLGFMGIDLLAFGVVCHQAWFISAYARRRRLWGWLLAVGSVAYVLFSTIPWLFDSLFWTYAAQQRRSGQLIPNPNPSTVTEDIISITILLALVVASIGMFWLLGMTTRRREQWVRNLQARAELATVTERNRIAREMHDIVAHSLTVIIAQADGGRYAGRQEPAKAVEALDTIAAQGRDALSQMRGLLSVLRDESSERATSANPGVAGIPDLCSDARRNGLAIDLRQTGEVPELSEAKSLTVYRIVQECLTNVLKHAGAVETVVALDWGSDRVTIAVDNAAGSDQLVNTAGPGRGLAGIAERAKVHGGSAQWGPSEKIAGGWNVTATIPY